MGGLHIGYEREGHGPPVVLLHGFVGDSREWRRQLDALSDEFTVIAWDAPGAGRSSDPPAPFDMSDYADCLAGFIRTQQLERVHVVGLSFGGALALELFRRHPTIPLSLVLAGAYAGWRGSLPREVGEQRLELCLKLASGPADDFVRTMIPGMFSSSPDADIVEEFGAIMTEFHPDGFIAMARALAEANLRDVLPTIDVPTLILNGDEDARASMSVAEDLLAAIPDSRFVVLPGTGHMSSIEAADRFNEEVRGFLRPLAAR